MNKAEIAPLMGAEIDATADFHYRPEKQQLSLDLKSDIASVQAAFEKNESTFTLTKPAKMNLTLTTEGYHSLDRLLGPTASSFRLNEPAQIQSKMELLSIPFVQNKPDWSAFSCKADLKIDRLNFSSKTSTQLNQIQLHIDHSTSQKPLAFSLSASGVPQGSIAMKGTLDLVNGSLNLDGRLDQFPSDAFDIASRFIGDGSVSMATVFGPQINLTTHSSLNHWNGPVQLQLHSPNIRASLDGAVSQGLLHLNEPFHMQMSITHDMSRLLLNMVNPLSLSSVSAEAPITLEIPAEGFSYPIRPGSDAKINIPVGRLELGKLYCHNEGNLNIALGLLKLSQFSQNQNIELWFAPLDFHIVNSVMQSERTEILIAKDYQICLWGNLNFDARKVKMVLGLTADCLNRAFGINNLPDNYILQIPLTGSFNKVKINTGKAAAKIGALMLWQQADPTHSSDQDAAGKVLGKFLHKLAPLPNQDKKAPPVKRPLPWDQDETVKKKTAVETQKHKKLIVPDEQPLKQVFKFLR